MIGLIYALLLAANGGLPSTPDLGKAQARCRDDEHGPAFLIEVDGLKDRQGLLKLEVYPADDQDFLQDDNILIQQGKVFRRVELPVPRRTPVELCIRVPRAGPYAVSVLHDRDGNHRFGLSSDGIGFGGNPRLGMSKPRAAAATIVAGTGPSRYRIVMNYRRSLFSFRPLATR